MQTPLISNGNASVRMFYYETQTHTYIQYLWLVFCIPFTCSCGGCLLGCTWWSKWTDGGYCGVLPSADVVSMCNSVMANTAHCLVHGARVVDVLSVVSPHNFSSRLLDSSGKL